MDKYGRPSSPNTTRKMIWNNLIQIIAGIFVLFALVYTWDSTENTAKVGVLFITLLYLLVRVSVMYQSQKFEKEIAETKEEEPEDDLYEKYLRKG